MSSVKRVALVTGASRGIGRAIALMLAEQDFIVVGTATSDKGAVGISEYLQAAGQSGVGKVLDVCDPDAVTAVVTEITEAFAAPSVLVNNAAVTEDNLFLRMKPEQWNNVIETNLNSLYRVTKACIKPMLKARWGRIIGVSSVVGFSGNPGQANYCAAKAGMVGFSKSLALEFARYGITSNCVAPGFIDTDMTRALNDKQREAILQQVPMGKIGKPEDIASAVAFLASEAAGYMTGQTLHVNGGMFG